MHTIETVVRGELKDARGYRLKVSILDLGMYIDGWRAMPSIKIAGTWWIQPPANSVNGKFVSPIEFDKTMSLWKEVQDSIIEAIETYKREAKEHALDGIQTPFGMPTTPAAQQARTRYHE